MGLATRSDRVSSGSLRKFSRVVDNRAAAMSAGALMPLDYARTAEHGFLCWSSAVRPAAGRWQIKGRSVLPGSIAP
jgi:hypothetical protein